MKKIKKGGKKQRRAVATSGVQVVRSSLRKARVNIQDMPDGTISVNYVYEGGGPRKDSHAHVTVYAIQRWMESQLKQIGPIENVKGEILAEPKPGTDPNHRLLILPLWGGDFVGGSCSCGQDIVMQRSGNYDGEGGRDVSMRDVQEIIKQFQEHAPKGQYIIGPFYKEDMDALMEGQDLGPQPSALVDAQGNPVGTA